MNKTEDIEIAIKIALWAEPLTLDQLMAKLRRSYDALRDIDPRWIGVAMHHLEQAGEIRYPDCDTTHNHEGDCVVEPVASNPPT